MLKYRERENIQDKERERMLKTERERANVRARDRENVEDTWVVSFCHPYVPPVT
jgi:hypothetical protein